MSDLNKTIESIRKDFPLISEGNIAYLDNAATTQKPVAVLNAVNRYYQEMNANPFRYKNSMLNPCAATETPYPREMKYTYL